MQPSRPSIESPSVSSGKAPTVQPSVTPSAAPFIQPSVAPSLYPSAAPSKAPSAQLSMAPSRASTASPAGSRYLHITRRNNDPEDGGGIALTAIEPSVAPSRKPSVTPTRSPSVAPSKLPTRSPSKATTDDYELFAVIGGAECAEGLYYGPSTLSASGSADGHAFYFWTKAPYAMIEHAKWLQVVTSDGSNELFRIYWTFADYKTLSQRFISAPTTGQVVSYLVLDTAGLLGVVDKEYSYSGSWRYSNNASISGSEFNVLTSTLAFSRDDGVWGAGSGTVDGNGAMKASFWGQGNQLRPWLFIIIPSD